MSVSLALTSSCRPLKHYIIITKHSNKIESRWFFIKLPRRRRFPTVGSSPKRPAKKLTQSLNTRYAFHHQVGVVPHHNRNRNEIPNQQTHEWLLLLAMDRSICSWLLIWVLLMVRPHLGQLCIPHPAGRRNTIFCFISLWWYLSRHGHKMQ